MLENPVRRKRSDAVLFAAGAVSVSLWLYFSLTTAYSSDDYWYSTFWDNGLDGFLKLTVHHYETMNGRALVHILAQSVLKLGKWAFALMCMGCCFLVPVAAARSERMDCKRSGSVALLFLLGTLLLPWKILNQGVFWISASCNYLFPSALICVFLIKLEQRQRLAWIIAFLCGATTEQMGLTTTLLCGFYLAEALFRKREWKLPAKSAAAAFMGVMTVFLSPATRQRASSEIRTELLEFILNLRWAIADEASCLLENPVPLLIVLALLVLLTMVVAEKSGKKWGWPVCATGFAGFGAGVILPTQLCWIGFVIGIVMLMALAVSAIVYQNRLAGGMVLAAVISMAVMLVTNSVDPRVMLPACYLFLLSALLLAAKRKCAERRMEILLAVVAAVTSICVIPAVKGFWHNYQIDRLNMQLAEEARRNHCIRYCTDYDLDYTWIKANADPYFRMKYLESCGFDERELVIFFSRSDPFPHMLYLGEEVLNGGVLTDDQGRVLLPLRQIVESLGGTVDWELGRTAIRFNEKEYELLDLDEQTIRILWTDSTGRQNRRDFAMRTYYTHAKYCEIGMFVEVLQIPVRLDRERFCYVIAQ